MCFVCQHEEALYQAGIALLYTHVPENEVSIMVSPKSLENI
jgi:hypothetical protein